MTEEERREFDSAISSISFLRIIDCEVCPEWFHKYQRKFWECYRPIVAICAGWQSGKTVSLPAWLKREIQRCGPGDYGAFSSTFKLLKRKFLPELKKEFKDFCTYLAGDMQFVFTEEGSRKLWGDEWDESPTVIQLGYAENPESLESATLKAVIWDECGQRLVPEQSFLTVQSRLMVNRGRMALASRPYESGWYERLVKGGLSGENELVDVVSFPSWANPVNPPESDPYWIPIRAKMPTWKFTILYEGQFTKPLGLIYDTFDYNLDTCEDFDIPKSWGWKFYPGMDFGPVNTAGLIIAENPETKELFVVREYHSPVKRKYTEHAASIRGGFALSVGAAGNHSEDDSRSLMRLAGVLLDEPPTNDVESQIQCVYEQLASHMLKFFRKACAETIADAENYSRKVDDEGETQDEIAQKSKWHRLDALRYIIAKLRPAQIIAILATPPELRFAGVSRPR